MTTVKPYTVKVPQEKLDKLKRQLDEAEFPTELEDNPGWDYGAPLYVPLFTHALTWIF